MTILTGFPKNFEATSLIYLPMLLSTIKTTCSQNKQRIIEFFQFLIVCRLVAYDQQKHAMSSF